MADSISRSLLIAEAEKRGYQVETIGRVDHFCKITAPDGRWEMFRGTRPMRSSANGSIMAHWKFLTMAFLQAYGYEVPPYIATESQAEAQTFLASHKLVVVKPLDAQRSEGVTVGIDTASKLEKAFAYARANSKSPEVMVQKQLQGNLYRLYAIDGTIVAAAHRSAAQVIGDGTSSVRQLIERLNQDPRRGDSTDSPLKKVHLEDAEAYLGAAALETVPKHSETVRVGAIESVSAGGEARDVTAQVHPEWQVFAKHVAEYSGLFVAGYDVICDDIAAPLSGNYIPLLEINSSPGLKLHEYPTGGGEPVHIAPLLLDALFPQHQ